MRAVAVGECVKAIKKWSPAKEAVGGTFRYIDIASVSQEDKSIVSNGEIPTSEAPSRARQLVASGDVLVSTVRPNLNAVALVPEELDGATSSTGFCVLRPDSNRLDSNYLFHWVRTSEFVTNMVKKATGQSYPAVSDKIVKDSLIPLPPLEEQNRIAAILDQADNLRRLRQRAIDRLDTLGQAIFYEMFGDPLANQNGYALIRTEGLFLVPPRIGTTKPARGEGCLIVRVGELGQRRIVFERCGRVILPESEIAKFKLERGDIVIARAIGSEGQLGKASLFDGHHEQVAIDSHVMRLRLNPSICDSTWFYTLLALPEGKKLLQQAGGATAVQFNINAKQASSLSVPLPPLAEQRHFASRINSLAQKSSHLKAHMRKLHGLFSSLQHRAFRGEL